MLLEPEKAEIVVMAILYLHNFLRQSETSSSTYNPPGTFDQEVNGQIILGTWRRDRGNGALNQLVNVP